MKLFPNEVPDPSRAFTTAAFTICLLKFSGLHSITEQLGDIKACELWTSIQTQIRRDVAAASGATVRSSTSEILITFATLDAAVSCLQSLINVFCSEQAGPPAASSDQGSVVATNTNGRLDYFGHTIDAARTLLSTTEAGCLAVPSTDLQEDEAIRSLVDKLPSSSIKRTDQGLQIDLT